MGARAVAHISVCGGCRGVARRSYCRCRIEAYSTTSEEIQVTVSIDVIQEQHIRCRHSTDLHTRG